MCYPVDLPITPALVKEWQLASVPRSHQAARTSALRARNTASRTVQEGARRGATPIAPCRIPRLVRNTRSIDLRRQVVGAVVSYAPPARNTVPAMSDSIPAWITAQSPDVRAELTNLIDYHPEPEFIRLLAEFLPVVPCPGLVDLYYDVWYCVPSRLALRIAMKQVHAPEELAQYLALSERVLVDATVCADFERQHSDADDVDEVIFWLKRRAGR